jgi:Regulator of ribonuclease activity B
MKFLKKLFSRSGKSKPKLPDGDLAQNDDWVTYKRYKDDDFWLVIVNRGLLKNNQLISMNWFAIEYRFLQRELVNGMFPKSDLSNLYYGFEDQLSEDIVQIGGELAATQTGFGTRVVWFCAPNIGLEEKLRAAAQKFTAFPVYVSSASITQYEKLQPSHLESQWAGNENILRTIAEHGDDGSEPRAVMHWAYGADLDSIARLADRLEAAGYIVEEQTGEKIVFSRLSVLTEDQSKRETTKLSALCDEHKCKYDGWETPVVKKTFH